MSAKRTNMLMKVVELAWLAVAAVSVVEIYINISQGSQINWLFVGALVVSVFMYFFRKKQRINYIRRNQE